MFSFVAGALDRSDYSFPVRKSLPEPADGSVAKLTPEARGWLDVWKQFLLACEQTGKYDEIGRHLLSDHLRESLSGANGGTTLHAFMESMFDRWGYIAAVDAFHRTNIALNTYRSALIFNKNGFGAVKVWFECTFWENKMHGIQRLLPAGAVPESVPLKGADATKQIALLTLEWRKFLALCEGSQFDAAITRHFTDSLAKVFGTDALQQFIGSFIRELGGIRSIAPLVLASSGTPIAAAATATATAAGTTATAATSPVRPTTANSPHLLAVAGSGLDSKHSHSRQPSRSTGTDPNGLRPPSSPQPPATASPPGVNAPAIYHSVVTFARGVYASWSVTFELQFTYDRLSGLRSLSAAEPIPALPTDRHHLLNGYQKLFSRFIRDCVDRKEYAAAVTRYLSPPLAAYFPDQKLGEFFSFLSPCGVVTSVGPVRPHPIHPTANGNNSFVCTIELARLPFGRWTATFELAFWRDKLSVVGCPAGVAIVPFTQPDEIKAQTDAWHECWSTLLTHCAAGTYSAAVEKCLTPSFAVNLPAPELQKFMTPLWAYGKIVSIGPLTRNQTAAASASASASTSGGGGDSKSGAAAVSAAAATSYTSRVILQNDVYAKYELDFVLYFWIDRLNGLMLPKGVTEANYSGDEKAAQFEGLRIEWEKFLKLCEAKRYRDAVANHYTEAMAEHLPEDKTHAFFDEYFRLYGDVTAVGAIEPVYSPTAKEQMYTSLVIFQRGVFSKWFCTFELAFWKDKINAVYCPRGAEMCHLTSDEREKQLTALQVIWIKFLGQLEEGRYADAVANVFTERMAGAVSKTALQSFYSVYTQKCGRIQSIGLLMPQMPESRQSYTSRVVYSSGVFSKWAVDFEVAFWADRINGFSSPRDAHPIEFDEHEKSVQIIALQKIWDSFMCLLVTNRYAEAVATHFTDAMSRAFDEHKLHTLMATYFDLGALRSIGPLTRVRKSHRKGNSSVASGTASTRSNKSRPASRAAGGRAPAAAAAAADDDTKYATTVFKSGAAGGGAVTDDASVAAATATNDDDDDSRTGDQPLDGDGDDDDGADDANDAGGGGGGKRSLEASIYRSVCVFGKSAYHRWTVLIEVHFWNDKICGLQTPKGAEFVSVAIPLSPSAPVPSTALAQRKLMLRYVPASIPNAAGSSSPSKSHAAAAPVTGRRYRLTQTIGVRPGHDFIIAQPLPPAHPSIRDLAVSFTGSAPGAASHMSVKLAGMTLSNEQTKRDLSYMRIGHPASATQPLEVNVVIEFVYTPRMIDDSRETLPNQIVATTGAGAGGSISKFMPAGMLPSPTNAGMLVVGPGVAAGHKAFNFSNDSSNGSGGGGGGGSSGQHRHNNTAVDLVDMKQSGGRRSSVGGPARRGSLTKVDASVVVPAPISEADRALYTAYAEPYTFHTPEAKQFIAKHSLTRFQYPNGGGVERDTDFGYRVLLWLTRDWQLEGATAAASSLVSIPVSSIGFSAAVSAGSAVSTSGGGKAAAKVTDEAGHATLFVSVLRANGIPARTAIGVWCDPASVNLAAAGSSSSSARPSAASMAGTNSVRSLAVLAAAVASAPIRVEFFSTELGGWIPVVPFAKSMHTVPFGVDPVPYAFLPLYFDRFVPAASASAAAALGAATATALSTSTPASTPWAVDWSTECGLKDGGRTTTNFSRFQFGNGAGAAGLWVVPTQLGLFSTDLQIRNAKVAIT